jgi:DNA topoisomerase-1
VKLIISEKEIAAKRIAQILSGNGVKEEKLYKVPVHGFSNSEGSFKTIGLKGHILQVEFPEEYSNWVKVPPENLIDAQIIKIPIEKQIIKALTKLAKEADEIIIATDYDREGELIGYDAFQLIRDNIGEIPAKRAKFSAITNKDIKSAFANLQNIDKNLAFAGMARQDIDLIWGAVLTRFISLASHQLKDKYLSVGRVQTPTLALIVDREIEINNFVKTPYWQIKVRLLTEKQQEFDAFHHKKRFLDEKEAKKIFDKLPSLGEIISIKEATRSLKPPTPLNTTGLIVAASALGFSAQKTINIAESLYMNGYISYPRTDNTVYPDSINIKEILKTLSASNYFSEMANEVLSLKEIKPTKGSRKTTDHPPIYPASVANKENLNEDEWKLYELVVRRFICTLLPEALIRNMVVNINIGNEKFIANGSSIIKEGWTKYYPYYKHTDIILPELKEGEKVTVINKEILAKETKPPSRYTQAKLVEKMEELNLGTKATRHTIIQNLINRGYIKGNPLEPSKKAIAVIKALKEHAEKITSPNMTAELEVDMDGIANGDLDKNEVIDISRKALKEIVKILNSKKEEIGKEIRESIKEDGIVGKCPDPNCNGDLIIRSSFKTHKKFIGCSNYPDCKKTFSLPQNGLIITTDQTCKICGYPIVKIIKKGKRPWELCINPDCPTKNENYKNYKNKKASSETN